MNRRFDALDERITAWMARNGVWVLRISLGLVYPWFGPLKLFEHLSPAEVLAGNTILALSGGRIPASVSVRCSARGSPSSGSVC